MQKKKVIVWIVLALFLAALLAALALFWPVIRSAVSVEKLEDGLYAMEYRSDYSLDEFLEGGGASSDLAVADFVIDRSFHGLVDLDLQGSAFGCSTLAVTDPNGNALFGRNFDWGNCSALIVWTEPKNGYASISTVNMDFLNLGLTLSEDNLVRLMSVAAPYAPMDGMNDQGLCVAVLMIEDSPAFDQDTGRPDLTTTTAVRLLLDRAATVDEAVALLEQYDLHASAGMVVHFAISDAQGRSVVAEYIDNELVVTDTPVVTNFYLTPGEKYGVGTAESQTRYAMLAERIAGSGGVMDMDGVRDALDSVSKHNFDSPFASTEWSIIYDKVSGAVRYYHRENYDHVYSFELEM